MTHGQVLICGPEAAEGICVDVTPVATGGGACRGLWSMLPPSATLVPKCHTLTGRGRANLGGLHSHIGP